MHDCNDNNGTNVLASASPACWAVAPAALDNNAAARGSGRHGTGARTAARQLLAAGQVMPGLGEVIMGALNWEGGGRGKQLLRVREPTHSRTFCVTCVLLCIWTSAAEQCCICPLAELPNLSTLASP